VEREHQNDCAVFPMIGNRRQAMRLAVLVAVLTAMVGCAGMNHSTRVGTDDSNDVHRTSLHRVITPGRI
jgi:hypothetical protein